MGYSPSVVALRDEAHREEAVGVGEGGGSNVWERGGYELGKGVGGGVGSRGEEAA